MAGRFERRAWPFLLFGPMLLVGFSDLILVPTAVAIIVTAATHRHLDRDHFAADSGAAGAA